MTRGRILCIIPTLLIALSASAAMDPFLEGFRVGKTRDPDVLSLAGPWPADLFDAAASDPLWDGDPDTPETRRLLRLILGDDAAAAAWLTAAVNDARSADALESAAISAADDSLCALVLARDHMDAETRFVWALRRRAAADPTGAGLRADDPLWPELFDLGPYDLQGGWDLWVAHRRAAGLSILPDAPLDDDALSWLLRLRHSRLRSRDVDRARTTRAGRAALGAACLPREDLRRHFGLHHEPPGAASLAAAWARGHWRLAGWMPGAAEDLGAMAALPTDVRADYWRRAADKHLSAGRWVEGERAMAAAVALAKRAGRRRTTARIADECGRVAALAAHRNRDADARRYAAWHDDLDGQPSDDPARAAHAAVVRAGGETATPPVAPGIDLDRAAAALETRMWALWVETGRELAQRLDADRYAALLESVADAGGTASRREAAAAVVASRLAGHPLQQRALSWAHVLEREHAAGGDLPARRSPVPDWTVRLGRDAAGHLDRHMLYGLCLLAGDARGRLAAAAGMPRPGLDNGESLLFLYPLPDRAAVRELVAEARDPALALGLARNESLFDPGVRSRAGALGWMQVMPFHFPERGVRGGEAVWRSPRTSVRLGLVLLADALERFDGDPYRACAAYNAGAGAVMRWDRQLGGEPDATTFLAWIGYPETRRYVEKVLIDRRIYAEVLKRFSAEVNTGR